MKEGRDTAEMKHLDLQRSADMSSSVQVTDRACGAGSGDRVPAQEVSLRPRTLVSEPAVVRETPRTRIIVLLFSALGLCRISLLTRTNSSSEISDSCWLDLVRACKDGPDYHEKHAKRGI